VFTAGSSSSISTDQNTVTDNAGNVTHQDHQIPVPLPAGYTLKDAVAALQGAMSSAMFETQFTPSSAGPTLSVAGNNVGLTATVQNLRPSFPIAVANVSETIRPPLVVHPAPAPAPTQINGVSLSLPGGLSLSSLQGAPYLSTQAEITTYMNSNPTTPAFCLSPPSATTISPGTSIQSVQLTTPARTPPTYSITLSSGVMASISSISLLVPLPTTPTYGVAPWGGVAGATATIDSAMRKAGNMARTLGNSINTLRQAQDDATQSVDVLDNGIGNLVDADMTNVSTRIQALQIQQQLGIQSLALGNQWPSLLLQLFK
jgi:flagellin-like hook-associated protein FlgL